MRWIRVKARPVMVVDTMHREDNEQEMGQRPTSVRVRRRRENRTSLSAILSAAAIVWAPAAQALDWNAAASVTVIEVTYIPEKIVFQTSTSVGNCPAGSWLSWFPRGADQASGLANVQAVLAALMTAKMANKRAMIFGDNANCIAQFIWLVD